MKKYMTFDLLGLLICALGAAEFAWSLLHEGRQDVAEDSTGSES